MLATSSTVGWSKKSPGTAATNAAWTSAAASSVFEAPDLAGELARERRSLRGRLVGQDVDCADDKPPHELEQNRRELLGERLRIEGALVELGQ